MSGTSEKLGLVLSSPILTAPAHSSSNKPCPVSGIPVQRVDRWLFTGKLKSSPYINNFLCVLLHIIQHPKSH